MAAARPQDEPWLTLHGPLPNDATPPRWVTSKSGEFVCVPLFPYKLKSSTGETLVQFGAQAGASLAQLVPKERKIRKLFIAVGNVFQRQDQPGYEVWLGVAAEIE
jgi:hypothetical protein